MTALLEYLYSEERLIKFGTLSQSPTQFQALWQLRESIAEAAGRAGKVYKYDVSVPPTEFVNVTNKVRERVKGKVHEVVGYGHVGDGMSVFPWPDLVADCLWYLQGNLHINVVAPAYTKEIEDLLEPFVFEVVGMSLTNLATRLLSAKDPLLQRRTMAPFQLNTVSGP